MKQKHSSRLLINTYKFIENLTLYTNIFKRNAGYGRWLAEYQRMEADGFFKPENMRLLYIEILNDRSELNFIYDDAIYYISTKAFDATVSYFDSTYCEIRLITGEIAETEQGEPLQYLSVLEAWVLCTQMNEEAEEELFIVYDSETNKPVFAYV